MPALLRRLLYLLRHREQDDALGEELEFHRALKQQELDARGLSAEDARLAARRELGNVTRAREDSRAVWLWPWLESVAQDLRLAMRGLLAAPSFTTLIASQRTRAGATDLYLALAKARSEAIKRNTNVTLSPKGGNWHDGWEIVNPSDSTSKLEDHNALSGITIAGPASVVYQSTGRVRGSTQPEFDFSFPGTSAVACVTVDLSGLPTQKSSSC